jgi:PAS domain S-box-containing protein
VGEASTADGRVPAASTPGAHGVSRFHLRSAMVLLVLSTILPMTAFAGWLVWRSWHDRIALADRQNVERARAISTAVDHEVEATLAALNAVAALDPVGSPEPAAFEGLASRLLRQQPGWRALHLADPSGQILASTEPAGARNVVPAMMWAVATSGRPLISNLLEDDPAAPGHFLLVAVPARRDDAVRAVLAAELRRESISAILKRQQPPENGVVTLIDGGRRIIARTRGESEYVGRQPSAGFVAASERMSEGSWREVLLEGTPAYAGLSRSPLTGWTLGVGLPAEAIDGPIQRAVWALAGVGAAVLASGLALAFVVSGLLGRALSDCARAARSLALGEAIVSRRSRVRELDELTLDLRDAEAILQARLRERDEAERARALAAADRERALLAAQDARLARQQDEARFAVTLRSIGDAVISTDAGGRVTMVNPVAEALTGWGEAAALGQPVERVFLIVAESTHRAVDNPVTKVFREGRIAGLANHTVLVTRDGREVPIEDSAAPIRDPDGALLGVVLVFRDVTAQREAERERAALFAQEQAARRQAEALSRSKDEFVATVSHELRTPLNAIFGWVRLLRGGALDEAGRAHALDVVERNTRAQTQLVDDLLDMSRVITGNLRLEMRAVELGPVVEAAIDAVRPTAATRDIEMALDTTGEAPIVSGDPDRLQQIIWNLLANSIKFTPKGGRIEARMATEGSEAVIEVRDTGIGIAPDLLPHVFERFRQRVSSETRTHGGLGIGLALVRHLVELHGGTVTAESAGEGHGATFTVRLPRLGQPAVQEVRTLPAPTARPDGPPALGGLRVLVVDDEVDARDLVGTVLRQAGAVVTPAASVRDAQGFLASLTPDVVVTDIAMPSDTGYDLLQHIRATPALAAIPVVALTAYNRRQDRDRALRAGFNFHVGKPVEPLALVHVVSLAAVLRSAAHRRE